MRCKDYRLEDVMEMLRIYFPGVKFESTRVDSKSYLLSTKESIDEEMFECIVQGNCRLQYVNIGKGLKFYQKLVELNPNNWYGKPRRDPDIGYFAPYIYRLNG